jgi:trehalose-phosphatase
MKLPVFVSPAHATNFWTSADPGNASEPGRSLSALLAVGIEHMPLPHLWKETFSDVRRWAGNVRMHSLLLDFDGTLTPLRADLDPGFVDSTVRRVLQEIQDTGRIAIAIISGRSLDEIRGRVGICGLIYAGNYGMEIRGPAVRYIDGTALAARDEIQLLALRFKYDLRRFQNLQIRNKGLSITIHWSTPQLPEIRKEIRRVVIDAVADGSKRFTVRDMLNSIDILPITTWNKGSAQWINRHLNVDVRDSMYVSDDRCDDGVFASLQEAITVKVGLADNTCARYVLKDSADVLTLLKLLLILLRGLCRGDDSC